MCVFPWWFKILAQFSVEEKKWCFDLVVFKTALLLVVQPLKQIKWCAFLNKVLKKTADLWISGLVNAVQQRQYLQTVLSNFR